MKRFEILARKENETTTIYIKTYNEVEAHIKEWELRMSGYNTRTIISEA